MTTMNKPLLYPIGEQDFANIRNDGMVYVDKTDLIYSLVKSGKYVFLSRPRRFGKSLLLSTLKYYFQGRRDLFEGLAIDRLETEWKQHPVLHLDMSQGKAINLDYLNSMLDGVLRHYEKVYHITPQPSTSFGTRLRDLIETAYAATGMPVVVLLDEYDAPVLENLDKPEQMEQVRNIMRDFYSPLKGQAERLRFVMITGITKFSQLSIFSELNNLNNITLLPQYEALCGITAEELATQMRPGVEAMAEREGVKADEMLDILKEHYDGYHFSEDMTADIYNPLSLVKALGNQKVYHYWFDSGTSTWLLRLLRGRDILVNELDGKEVDQDSFDRPTEQIEDPTAVLYQSGYLTIKDYDRETQTYTLGIPNKEVREGLSKAFVSHLAPRVQSREWLRKAFFTWRRGGSIDDFMSALHDFYASIPYDIANDNERHYQAILYAVMASFGADVRVEDRTSDGRADVVVLLPNEVYVMELKHGATAQEAMEQLQRKDYAVKYRRGDRPVRLLAMNINRDTRTIDDWLCQ